jgi:hypothetical protein
MRDFHLQFIFQTLVLGAIILVLWQIKVADCLDIIRFDNKGAWFWWRRTAMFLKLVALCWTVVYSYENHWAPWPPILAFIAAFDFHVITQIFIMRRDLARLERLSAISGRNRARHL